MVKKKANVSIDEWLEGGVFLLGTSPTTTVTAAEGPAPSNIPAAEVVPELVLVEPVTTPVANVAVPREEEANLFWTLLEQSGYERW